MNQIKYFIFGLLITNYSLSQTSLPENCGNAVSTNPNGSSFNGLLPIFNFEYGDLPDGEFEITPGFESQLDEETYGNLFLNLFNPFSAQSISSGIPLSNMNHSGNMASPWTNGVDGPITMWSSLYNSGTMNYSNYNPVYENGWEVLSLNLGRFPNDLVTMEDFGYLNTLKGFPYILLYNRYTGVLRIFGNCHERWAENNAYNAVRINFEHFVPDEESGFVFSGVLRHGQGKDLALDRNSETTSITVLTSNPNNPFKWFVADFQLAYDPCVCSYPSMLKFTFDFVNQQDAVYNGVVISSEAPLVDQEQLYALEDLFLNFEANLGSQTNSGGLLMYNTLLQYLQKYDALMSQYSQMVAINDRIKYEQALVKFAMALITMGASTASTGGGTTQNNTFINILIANNASLEVTNYVSIAGEKKIDPDKALKEFGKVMAKGSEFMIQNYWKQNDLSKPTPIQVSTSQVKITGVISEDDPYTGGIFFNPGSVGNSFDRAAGIFSSNASIERYPVYNSALGVFAVLETPKIIVSKKNYSFESAQSTSQINLVNSSQTASRDYITTGRSKGVLQIKLAEQPKYVFNPVLEIEEYEIDASLIVRLNPHLNSSGTTAVNDKNPQHSVNFANATNLSIDPIKSMNVESMYSDFMNYHLLPKNEIDISTIPYPLNAMSDIVGSIGVNREYNQFWLPSQINMTTSYFNFTDNVVPWLHNPTDIEQHIVSNFHYNEQYFMKFIVRVKYSEPLASGDDAEFSYVFTVPIDEANITFLDDDYINQYAIAGSEFDMGEENKSFGETHFDGSPVSGCAFWEFDNTYRCRAWNNIDIMGEITIDAPYQVLFQAGNAIVEHPNAVLPPESVREIVPFLDFSDPILTPTAEEVEDFCRNGKYAAHNRAPLTDEVIVEESQDEIPEFDFIVFPNPTSSFASLNFELFSQSNVSVSLMDLSGNLIDRFELPENVIGMQRVPMNLSELSAGVYFVQVIVNEQSYVKRIIKQ